jgi:hypothetical protein
MAQHLLSVDATARYANPSANLVRPGPLYFSGVYLGDDPDPNIRFRSCAISLAGLAATQLTAPRCWLRRLCSV